MAHINPGTAKPLQFTDTIENAGAFFYGANKSKSYRLAKTGAIVVKKIGPRLYVALMHATARSLGIDPTTI